jgi:hypothetical protein
LKIELNCEELMRTVWGCYSEAFMAMESKWRHIHGEEALSDGAAFCWQVG